ncbi:hypothetical protein [Methylocystis sp. S23]|jgi:hypothetical protein
MTEETRRGYKIEVRNKGNFLTNFARTIGLIRTEGAQSQKQELLIDGATVPYIKTEEGYKIFYGRPKDTLLEAARSYIDTQREK